MPTTFLDLGVSPDLNERLRELGFTRPFPIQELTLTDSLAGNDVSAEAPTGSGKTLAFALPVAMSVGRGTPGRPRALLLAPTRELASQTAETLAPLLEVTGGRAATFYGGTSINRDLQRLKGRIDVVVATPGRLEDLIDRGALALGDVDLVVLDEADRMADMGFLPAVKRLLDATSPDRRTLLFSATLDGDVEVLIRRYQVDPVTHRFATPEQDRADVRHVFWPAERPERRRLTGRILSRSGTAIVFTRTKHGADRLAKQLRQDGVSTAAIHGNRSQRQREQALARFSRGEVQALIATDVAARGIHVDDVDLVLHYDRPATEKDYVHRSGRTGRAGALGLVVSMVAEEEADEHHRMQHQLAMAPGMHDLELDLLDAEVLPEPTPPADDRRGGRGAGPGSGQRSRPGGNTQRRGGGQGRGRNTGGKGNGRGGNSSSSRNNGSSTRGSGGGARGADGNARTRARGGHARTR